jgi:hypothetical protein
MCRCILRWIAPVVLVASLWLPGLRAQVAPSPGSSEIQRGYTAQPGTVGAEEGGKTPAFAYTIAFLFTLLVMVIVCSPSRKQPVLCHRLEARRVSEGYEHPSLTRRASKLPQPV